MATVTWLVALIVFFLRTPKLLGASLLDPDQLWYFATHTNRWVILAFGYGAGSLFVVLEALRDRARLARATLDLLIAAICGITLVLLVAGVGESPRHYIAEVGLLIALGTAGWAHGLARLVERDRLTASVLAVLAVGGATALTAVVLGSGLPGLGLRWLVIVALGFLTLGALRWLSLRGHGQLAGTVIAVAALVAAMGYLGERTARLDGELDGLERRATSETVAWIKDNVTPGRSVALGSYLSMQISIDLPAGSRIIRLRHFLAIADPKMPFGLRSAEGPLRDPIAIDTASNKASQFNVFSASQVRHTVLDSAVEYYIYPVNRGKSSASILGSLTPDNGFTEVQTKLYEGSEHAIDVHVYRIDQARVKAPQAIFISAEALERLTDLLEQDPANGRQVASALVLRIVPAADGSEDDLLDRLRTLAGS